MKEIPRAEAPEPAADRFGDPDLLHPSGCAARAEGMSASGEGLGSR